MQEIVSECYLHIAAAKVIGDKKKVYTVVFRRYYMYVYMETNKTRAFQTCSEIIVNV